MLFWIFRQHNYRYLGNVFLDVFWVWSMQDAGNTNMPSIYLSCFLKWLYIQEFWVHVFYLCQNYCWCCLYVVHRYLGISFCIDWYTDSLAKHFTKVETIFLMFSSPKSLNLNNTPVRVLGYSKSPTTYVGKMIHWVVWLGCLLVSRVWIVAHNINHWLTCARPGCLRAVTIADIMLSVALKGSDKQTSGRKYSMLVSMGMTMRSNSLKCSFSFFSLLHSPVKYFKR